MKAEFKKQQKKAKSGKGIRVLFWILLIAFISILAIPAFEFLTSYLEAKEIGAQYTVTVRNQAYVKVITQAIVFAAFFVVTLGNLLLIRKRMYGRDEAIDFLRKIPPLVFVVLVFATIISFFKRSAIADSFLQFANSTPFNMSDPLFDKDIGYFMFHRPFLVALTDGIWDLFVFESLFCILFYLFLYARIDFTSVKEMLKDKWIVTHAVINVLLCFAAKALTYRLRSEGVLYKNNGDFTGGGFVDVNIWLRFNKIAPYLILLAAVFTIVMLLRNKLKGVLISILAYPAIWFIVLLISLGIQAAVVMPSEVSMEQRYIEYNIDYTRKAYAIDSVEERIYQPDDSLSLDAIQKNATTMNNVRVTDLNQTLQATNTLQGIKNYYQFTDEDVVEYTIDGVPRAVSIAAREFDQEKVQSSAKNYINEKLRYTHGYGVVMNPVSELTEEGQPKFIIKDIPVQSYSGAPTVVQPRIYYGELTKDYCIVNSSYNELDYLEDGVNVEYNYQGKAGIPMTFWNRLVYAIKNRDIMMLASGYITSESKLLENRNVLDRVKKAAPFLTYDTDPYLLIDDDGSLKWVIDAYTTSEYYPYAEYRGDFNYIRNSAKAIVDAYDGTVDIYVIDESDPVISTYDKIYPGVLKHEQIPESLRSHIRYSETMFRIQSEMYTKYHVTNAENFYGKTDLWQTAKEKGGTSETRDVEPYYNLMKLEELGETEELVLMLPFTPAAKDNLIAWMAAGSKNENYGKLVVYKFPEGETVYGTMNIENRIDNDTNISKELSLWDQGGSQVIKGNLLIIPIENSLLYIEPIYLTAGDASLPEVKRIVVAYQDRIAMEANLETALNVLFGQEQPTFVDTGETAADLVNKAMTLFRDLKNYNKENDWENFGKTMSELDQAFQDIEARKAELGIMEPGAPEASPAPSEIPE